MKNAFAHPRFRISALAAVLLAGCASETALRPLAMNDPANPDAPESPVQMQSRISSADLRADSTGFDSAPSSQSDEMAGMSHDMSGMNMHDMAGMHAHGAGPATTQAAVAGHALYTCKMHPKIVSDKPGNCPICGMKLIKKPAPAREEPKK